MKLRLDILLVTAVLAFGAIAPASAGVTVVPPGNRNAEQPNVPGASARRTRAMQTTYEAKYQRVYHFLKSDSKLRGKIRAAADRYGIDPMHIVGAIVGEHTYNVDVYDRLQTYYVKAISYLKSALTFEYRGESLGHLISRPQFEECVKLSDSYEIWACRERIWNRSFRGKVVGGRAYPDDRFGATFFQPFYAGQTFGIGQLNPLTALQMSDFVHRVSGLPRLDYRDPQEVYHTIMDPDLTLEYVAATLKKSMDAYRNIAGFDISDNPGITATLYNLGDPEARAEKLRDENRKRRAQGLKPRLPQENYYGWLVNEKLPELSALFQ